MKKVLVVVLCLLLAAGAAGGGFALYRHLNPDKAEDYVYADRAVAFTTDFDYDLRLSRATLSHAYLDDIERFLVMLDPGGVSPCFVPLLLDLPKKDPIVITDKVWVSTGSSEVELDYTFTFGRDEAGLYIETQVFVENYLLTVKSIEAVAFKSSRIISVDCSSKKTYSGSGSWLSLALLNGSFVPYADKIELGIKAYSGYSTSPTTIIIDNPFKLNRKVSKSFTFIHEAPSGPNAETLFYDVTLTATTTRYCSTFVLTSVDDKVVFDGYVNLIFDPVEL